MHDIRLKFLSFFYPIKFNLFKSCKYLSHFSFLLLSSLVLNVFIGSLNHLTITCGKYNAHADLHISLKFSSYLKLPIDSYGFVTYLHFPITFNKIHFFLRF